MPGTWAFRILLFAPAPSLAVFYLGLMPFINVLPENVFWVLAGGFLVLFLILLPLYLVVASVYHLVVHKAWVFGTLGLLVNLGWFAFLVVGTILGVSA